MLRSRVVALLPAHNEERTIAQSIASIRPQVDEVVVAADNCTDGTVAVSRAAGARVIETVGNKGMRAGALNQALDVVLPAMDDNDLVVAMDADTVVDADLVRHAIRRFVRDRRLGAVAANQVARTHNGLLELLQAMEAERNRRYIGRKRGRAGAMSGMASIFRVAALRDLVREHGSVYDESAWTEDWQMTFSLKHAGWRCIRPKVCTAQTLLVTSWKNLFFQRERWARGYFQTLTRFGVTRKTLYPWIGQIWGFFNIAIWMMWIVLVIRSSAIHGFRLPAWVLAMSGILILERTIAIRHLGWRAITVSITGIVEMVYLWWLTAAMLSGTFKHVFGISGQWNRVKTGKEEATWIMDRSVASL